MKMRPAEYYQVTSCKEAIDYLRNARFYLKHADCPKTLARVRSALKSAEGALRHAHRRYKASKGYQP